MQDSNSVDPGLTEANGALTVIDSQPPPPTTLSEDLLGDLLGPLAIEGPPGTPIKSEQNLMAGLESVPSTADNLALAPVEEQANSVQVWSFLFV